MSKSKTISLLLGTVMAAAVAHAPAVAQSGAPSNRQTGTIPEQSADPARTGAAQSSAEPLSEIVEPTGEIIVTANRRAEPLARVGVSIAAVSAEQLAIFDVEQPQDLRRVVPGFQAVEAASTGAPVFVLRGVGFDAPTPAISSPAGIYVDEVAVPYPYMSLGLAFDLERVEVLKGSQGTLYGRNTTGGLVNFIAAKPTPQFEAALCAGFGNYQSHEFEGFVSGPLGAGVQARRLPDA